MDNSIANALGIKTSEPSSSKGPIQNMPLKRSLSSEAIASGTQTTLSKGASEKEPDNKKVTKIGNNKEPTYDNNPGENYDDLD